MNSVTDPSGSSFGLFMKNRREALNLKQAALATLLSVSTAVISSWETRRTSCYARCAKNPEFVDKLASALQVDKEKIIERLQADSLRRTLLQPEPASTSDNVIVTEEHLHRLMKLVHERGGRIPFNIMMRLLPALIDWE